MLIVLSIVLGMLLASYAKAIELHPLIGFLVMITCQIGFIGMTYSQE